MKKNVFLLLLIFCYQGSFAQSSIKKKTSKRKKTNTHVVAAVAETPVPSSQKLHTVSGEILQTSSYCGGAAIDSEEMQKYQQPYPYPSKVLHVRKDSVNDLKNPIVAHIVPNEKGQFSIELPPGIYSIVVDEQLSPIDYSHYNNVQTQNEVDINCLKKWWSMPYSILVVKDKNISGLQFVFNHRCFVNNDIPCFYYSGPMPP